MYIRALFFNIFILVFLGGNILAASVTLPNNLVGTQYSHPKPEFSVSSPSYDYSSGLKPNSAAIVSTNIGGNAHYDDLKQSLYKTKKDAGSFSIKKRTISFLFTISRDHNIWLSGHYFLFSPFHDFW